MIPSVVTAGVTTGTVVAISGRAAAAAAARPGLERILGIVVVRVGIKETMVLWRRMGGGRHRRRRTTHQGRRRNVSG
jgi:hypothetical protein